MKTESIAVHYFYPFHHGVDPSFSEDGETFHCTRYNSVFDVAIAIASYALDLFFYLLAYLHPSSEERTLRHLFLQAAVAERTWHYFTAEAYIQNVCRPDSYFMMEYYEHELCERLGELAKNMLRLPKDLPRVFANELLYPLHALAAHPESTDSPRHIVSDSEIHAENSILARMIHLGLKRLRKSSFTECSELLPTHYVTHADFIKKTTPAKKNSFISFDYCD